MCARRRKTVKRRTKIQLVCEWKTIIAHISDSFSVFAVSSCRRVVRVVVVVVVVPIWNIFAKPCSALTERTKLYRVTSTMYCSARIEYSSASDTTAAANKFTFRTAAAAAEAGRVNISTLARTFFVWRSSLYRNRFAFATIAISIE